MKIFINPGHGGLPHDPGAIGPAGNKESDVNARIAAAAAERLKAAGHKVVLYQQQRKLADVAAKANKSKADLFVSIHCNAASNTDARGTETWYYTGCPHGRAAAVTIQREVVKVLQSRNRGVKSSRSLYVLRKTIMPAVLVEVGFLSNAAEEKEIVTKAAQIGQAIADGIITK
jgi:N-acetylmuramoyl-L-alanine amidase